VSPGLKESTISFNASGTPTFATFARMSSSTEKNTRQRYSQRYGSSIFTARQSVRSLAGATGGCGAVSAASAAARAVVAVVGSDKAGSISGGDTNFHTIRMVTLWIVAARIPLIPMV
jgi:hypothetical protein